MSYDSVEKVLAEIEAKKLIWQGMEQQALEPPANRPFAQLAHDTWCLLASAARLLRQPQEMTDAAEMLWVVLANVSGSDWTQQSTEWQEVTARWRDNYFAALKAAPAQEDPS